MRSGAVVPLLVAAVVVLAPLPGAQDWPGGAETPSLADLGVSDPDNSPLSVDPGHTDEELCAPEVNTNLERQLDLTETYLAFDSQGRLFLRSYYNTNSAASTTRQFWFFDIDNDPNTGGPDNVLPDYNSVGKPNTQGALPCSTPECTVSQLTPTVYTSGFEYYIMSYGSGTGDLALFGWSEGLGQWIQLYTPAGARNLQGSADNPYNAYPGDNGYRGLADFPPTIIGLYPGAVFRTFSRSWSCIVCCGDDNGGSFLPPGVTECASELCGDCDGSGDVTILDSLRAALYDAGLATLTPVEFSNCNVAGVMEPGYGVTVSVLDSLTIAQYVVGQTLLSCCTP